MLKMQCNSFVVFLSFVQFTLVILFVFLAKYDDKEAEEKYASKETISLCKFKIAVVHERAILFKCSKTSM